MTGQVDKRPRKGEGAVQEEVLNRQVDDTCAAMNSIGHLTNCNRHMDTRFRSQTSNGPFLAVSTPILQVNTKCAFLTVFQDYNMALFQNLQDLHTFASPDSKLLLNCVCSFFKCPDCSESVTTSKLLSSFVIVH